MLGTILICAVLAVFVGFAIRTTYKNMKSGQCAGGCGSCGGCGGCHSASHDHNCSCQGSGPVPLHHKPPHKD